MTLETDSEVTPGGRHRHPLGWYGLAIPPGWRVADASEPLRILAARDEGAAVVSVTKAPHGDAPRAALRTIVRDVPGLHVIERRGEEEGLLRGMCFARVEELIGERPPWWAFWRRPRVAMHLLTTCYSRGPLLALLTFEVAPDLVDRHRLAVGALFGSFDLAANPIASPAEFLSRFLAIARERTPGRKILPTGPLSVSVDGASLILEQHYRALACEPEIGDAVFDRIFAFLSEGRPPRADARFEEVRESVLLTVKSREWIEDADRNVPERARVLRIPFPNETALVFVVDHPHVMRFVTVEESERWEVPPKEMFRIAKENLGRLRPPSERMVLDPGGKLCAIALTEGDGYDAARIVLPGLQERLRRRLGEHIAVGIPNRDFLIAFATEDPRVVDAIRRRIAEDYKRRPYPISDRFFRLMPDGTLEAF